jgi:hypothetical protein
LRNHDRERSQGGATNSWDGEQLNEASDIVALFVDERCFHAKLGINVVQIAGGLKLGVAKALERLERVFVFALFDVPTWRFWELSEQETRDCQSTYLGRNRSL